MALKDIEKLKEKVGKDPTSKLFVPLAEEYRKEGMLDDAIKVLQKGLERQPGYMSARVSLGKIYFEKGMLPEARAEFETVVKSIPDNLYAQKKLAEIYRDAGERTMAVKAYKAVLKINALDEDATANLRSLEGVEDQAAVISETKAVGAEVPEEPFGEIAPAEEIAGSVKPEELAAFGEFAFEESPAEEKAVEEAPISEDFAAFADFGRPEAAEETAAEAVKPEELAAFGEFAFEESPVEEKAVEEAPISEDFAAFADIGRHALPEEEFGTGPAKEVDMSAFEEASFAAKEEPEEVFGVEEEISFTDVSQALKAETQPLRAVTPEVVEAVEIPSVSPEPAALRPESAGRTAALADADRMIAGGDYIGALRIYRTILSANPGDNALVQRVDELRSLLKLLGKDKEALIERLNAFMEGIRKRRDEFFRSA